ncbi:hypothetical protein Tco_0994442 [Tanacetum coccineum]
MVYVCCPADQHTIHDSGIVLHNYHTLPSARILSLTGRLYLTRSNMRLEGSYRTPVPQDAMEHVASQPRSSYEPPVVHILMSLPRSEEEEHLARLTLQLFLPTDELFPTPEGTDPALYHHPQLTLLLGLGLPSGLRLPYSLSTREEKVERTSGHDYSLTIHPISRITSPSAGERLARCIALPAHSSPPPVPSPLLPSSGCLPRFHETQELPSHMPLLMQFHAALPSPHTTTTSFTYTTVDRRMISTCLSKHLGDSMGWLEEEAMLPRGCGLTLIGLKSSKTSSGASDPS